MLSDALTHRERTTVLATTLSLAVVCLAVASLAADSPAQTRWVRRVVYERRDVFMGDDLPGIQRLANRFHITTRETVLARKVLLEPGDALDDELVAESERKLRKLDFLHDAEIDVRPAGPDSVDLLVTTHDQWSLVPSAILSSGGGLTRFGGSLEEMNFLGRGKYLWGAGEYENDVGTTWSAGYDDPQVLGSELEAGVSFASGPLLQAIGGYVEKPFQNSDVLWSWGGWASASDEIVRLFDAGEEASRYEERSDDAGIWATRAIGERYRKWRFTLQYSYYYRTNHVIEGETNAPLPVNELAYTTTAEISREHRSFVVERRINKLGRKEDLTLGNNSSLAIGRAGFPIPKGEKRWDFHASHAHVVRLGEHQYLFLNVGFNTKVVRDTIVSFGARWYDIFGWHTLAAKLSGKFSNDLDRGSQFTLGADNGLRGYPARQFTGVSKVLLNLESRIVPSWELWTVAMGGVAFVDVGNVWKRGERMSPSDLNVGAGVGLRLEFTRTPGAPVSQIDVGWPVNRSGGPALTLGVGQQF